MFAAISECGDVNNLTTTVNITPASPTRHIVSHSGTECKTGPYTLSAEIIETGKLIIKTMSQIKIFTSF